MDGKFLLPSLNQKAAVSTNSGSYPTHQKDTEQIMVPEGKTKRDKSPVNDTIKMYSSDT